MNNVPHACQAITIPSLSADRPMLLVAAAALIDAEGRVLLTERPAGKPMAGLWEFPGGKVEAGETPEAALSRELKEELDLAVAPGCFWPLTFASHPYERFHLLMPVFGCRVWSGTPQPREGQRLVWAAKQDWRHYAMPPADVIIVQNLWELI